VHFFIGLPLPSGFLKEFSDGVAAIILIILLIGGGFQIKETIELNNYYRQNCNIGKKAAGELHRQLNLYIIIRAESGKFDEIINIDSGKHKQLKNILTNIQINKDCFAPTNIGNKALKQYRFGHLVPIWCNENEDWTYLETEEGFRKSHNENPIGALKAAERILRGEEFKVGQELPFKVTSGRC
jgi:hypothetical protein